jgi:hypothetical protein
MSLEERSWDTLVRGIGEGICTPFLGAAVNLGILSTGTDIAQRWAAKHGYPLTDSWDLTRVSQFMAVDSGDPMWPKDQAVRELDAEKKRWLVANDFSAFLEAREHPLAVLAALPFPIYITTNYDDLIVTALEGCTSRTADGQVLRKTPRREVCRWNKYVRRLDEARSVFDSPDPYEPSPQSPVVFHLHGHDGIRESLVLTESDYLDFLVNVTRDQQAVLPARIQRALAASTLLFVGYSLADWSFRVLLRGVIQSLEASNRRASVAVQLPPGNVAPEHRDAALEYLQKYLGSIGDITVHVYWGDVNDFVKELLTRWQALGSP